MGGESGKWRKGTVPWRIFPGLNPGKMYLCSSPLILFPLSAAHLSLGIVRIFNFKFSFMETLVRYGLRVQKMYDAYQKGDISFILSCLNHDVIWEVMGQPEVPFAGIYHGPDDVKNFFGKLNDHVEPREFMAEHILENNHTVVATGHMNAVGRKTSKNFSTFWSMVWEFNDEQQVVHFRDCFDTLAFAKALTR
jgi:ketosteroid isomerase-like protein